MNRYYPCMSLPFPNDLELNELEIHQSSKNCIKQTARHWASLLAFYHTSTAGVIWHFSYYWADCSYFQSHFSFRHLKVELLLSKKLLQWWNSKTHQGYSHNTKSISGFFSSLDISRGPLKKTTKPPVKRLFSGNKQHYREKLWTHRIVLHT